MTDLRVDYCDHQAAKFACERWHYSGNIPPIKNVKFGVWENGEFIGAVIYSRGANPYIGDEYDLTQAEATELTRVALTDHDSPVSQIVAYTLKMLDKKEDGLRLVVSYADPSEDHVGTIYQAMNWIYVGKTEKSTTLVDPDGNTVHSRTASKAKQDNLSTADYYENLDKKTMPGKYKYLYPLDDTVRERIEPLRQEYPKEVDADV